jgi:hypothetical protein
MSDLYWYEAFYDSPYRYSDPLGLQPDEYIDTGWGGVIEQVQNPLQTTTPVFGFPTFSPVPQVAWMTGSTAVAIAGFASSIYVGGATAEFFAAPTAIGLSRSAVVMQNAIANGMGMWAGLLTYDATMNALFDKPFSDPSTYYNMIMGTIGGSIAAEGFFGYLYARPCPPKPNVTGVPKTSKLDDIFENPNLLKNMTPDEIKSLAEKEGWKIGTLSHGTHRGQGVTIRDGTDRLIQWHPGGGSHGPSPYWKVSSGKTGIQRIFTANK